MDIRSLDNSKICFIICVNNDRYMQECLEYIKRMIVPEGMTIDFLTVAEATSMCAGYNEAIEASDAKYKIYLHQDVLLKDSELLNKLLRIFQDSKVGMIGINGITKMTSDFVPEHGDKADPEDDSICSCQVVGNFFMATQYDIPWREDIFDGWDFYEVSQCAEFRKNGYKVVVAGRSLSDGIDHLRHFHGSRKFEVYREKALSEYGALFGVNHTQKKVALVLFKEISFDDIAWGLLQTKYDATIIDTDISVHSIDKVDVDYLSRQIQKEHAHAVISFDFCPALSDACKECGVKYAAWIYDAPQKALYEDQIRNDCNYIFSFDKYQVNETRKIGANNVYHMPLAGNVLRSRSLEITEEDKRKYSCEVSFIGNLYTDNIYLDAEKSMSEATKAEYNAIVNDALDKWDGVNRINDRLSDAALKELTTMEPESFGDDFKMDLDEFFGARLIARYIAHIERVEMLKRLSKYKLKFFTGETEFSIPGIKFNGPLSHDTELPKAYALSKININSTLHSIPSGIPLRVFEIMSVGGFVLSNYQPEIDEFFDIGKEIEVYHCLDEMDEKVRFYLSHDRLRNDIAARGFEAIRTKYNYEKQVQKIMEVVFNT